MAPILRTSSKTPSVYVEEVSSAARSMAGVDTTVTTLIGLAAKGPLSEPTAVTSFRSFQQKFGSLRPSFNLGYAVRLFFQNGGGPALVIRIPKSCTRRRVSEALASLDRVDLINLLVIPGVSDADILGDAEAYARKRRAFLIVDAPKTAVAPADMLGVRRGKTLPRSSFAAVYYPWVNVRHESGSGPLRCVPPSGAVAGYYVKTDRSRGVWKAPAGPEALSAVRGLAHTVSDTEQDMLNPEGVNALRSFPSLGYAVWGARTLATGSGSEFTYVSVRRTALFIEESVSRGIRWAAFEPNDAVLWPRVRKSVEQFLYALWRRGAFQGATAKKAYFVQCGFGTTMTQDDLDRRRLVIELGFAPLRPAEFVILRFQQKTA